jgi:hypothetical protein
MDVRRSAAIIRKRWSNSSEIEIVVRSMTS